MTKIKKLNNLLKAQEKALRDYRVLVSLLDKEGLRELERWECSERDVKRAMDEYKKELLK